MMTENAKFDSWIESTDQNGQKTKTPLSTNVGMTKLVSDIADIVPEFSKMYGSTTIYRAIKSRNIVPVQESEKQHNALLLNLSLFAGIRLGEFKYNIVIYYQRKK